MKLQNKINFGYFHDDSSSGFNIVNLYEELQDILNELHNKMKMYDQNSNTPL